MKTLLYEVRDQVAYLTMHRPEVYHALSPELLGELNQAFKQADSEERIRVIVLTGSGDKAFCSGADLKLGIGESEGMGQVLREHYLPLIQTMRRLPKPIIARLNGVAAGAGAALALACDLRIAAGHASMAQLFVHIGLIPDAGTTFFLPRLVGLQRAFEWASTGKTLPAAECHAWGLVNDVVPGEQLDEAVSRWTEYYTQAPTLAIGYLKQLLNESATATLETMLDREAECQELLGKTQDVAEGLRAFRQKRKPNFQGR
ncbi:2-(1,2-epoxy-1,2-dihydrophenyl)acetyl-CoA isomerase [Siphonobacter sp. BAB-5385]|uniref:enoyl-CoA hydratase/isomerase family protein n=1 Tax=unclassified Siphonobacter TaxID=2635712 RepID=UPI000B9E65E2|nr:MULTISPECIES: enoyl-CoA hydratase-related protein [unclassified Siphonobacter]OZI09477.1 2-(1,2-epoxy-1,2-dihydrophenyl)acetyl-CoA isomerase [Siphonobacter sp. BAB-5385]PMD99235.1 2-(1,2-epoxy-1,2-dihydrophenyl)acetyl-CoA isomerase [Siphonobacter sp. BAB-5405]